MARGWPAARLGAAALLLALTCSVVGVAGVKAASCMANTKVYVLVEGTTTDAAAAAIDAVGAKVDKRLEIVNAVGAWVHTKSMAALSRRPGVRYVSPSTAV